MTQNIPTVEEMVADGGAVYVATVPNKKQLLLRMYDLYEAGKKQDEIAYYRIRTEVLEIVYEIQRTTLTTYGNQRYEEGVKAERERIDREWVSLNLRNDNEENWNTELSKFGVFMQNNQ